MRINARLDDTRSRKLEFLTRSTNQGTTEIVKRAIDLYYEQVASDRPKPVEVLNTTGFIACGEADKDLSSEAKDTLRQILGAKSGDR